ncbi:phosphatase PAP2 family protein [Faecalispora jeddahensis]|uniref:phosphatase PAP2 family protein n=1 Tax=Faecalispora jeddahensis TaxID=1414721 RepID=UPI0028A5A3BF|nr:phosphatase PAP2 family protein [Faecalispora jeddahensis]
MPAIQRIDNTAFNFIHNNLRFPVFDKIMPVVSWIGNNGVCWIATALLFLVSKKYRAAGIVMIGALAFCALIGNFVLKPLTTRIRPCNIHTEVTLLIPRPSDFSFPSGHTASSFAAATVIYMTNTRLGTLGFVLATLIAFSRIYLYVHYLSDIVAGIIMGIGLACVSMQLAAAFRIF